MKRRNLSNRLRVVEDGGVTFGDVVYGAGEGFGPRWQADFQLVLIVTGSARIAVSGIERVVRAGEVTLLRPGREESFAWDAAGRTRTPGVRWRRRWWRGMSAWGRRWRR